MRQIDLEWIASIDWILLGKVRIELSPYGYLLIADDGDKRLTKLISYAEAEHWTYPVHAFRTIMCEMIAELANTAAHPA